jgi:hypothetical protein
VKLIQHIARCADVGNPLTAEIQRAICTRTIWPAKPNRSPSL